jgi:hypothetical protein
MPTPLRAGLVLLVLASPALAQQISLNFGSGGANLTTFPFNQGDCNSGVSYTVTWTSSGLSATNACGNTQIFVTNSQSCPTTPNTTGADGGTQDVIIGTIDISTIATGSGSIPTQKLRDMPGLGGSCPDGVDITNSICASLSYRAVGSTSCDSTLGSSTTLNLRYDAKPPVPPGMTLLGQDSKIVVQLDAQGESLLRYEIQYAEAPSNDAGPVWKPQSPLTLEATKNTFSITGLTNAVEYFVRARSIDEVSNPSDYNDPQSATPQASNGFWGEYKDAGGHELGGCSVADAAVPTVLGALGVLVALARRRR